MQLQRQLSNYFKPKAFEYLGANSIYDFVGIGIYKKYLPTSGDIVMKWRNQIQIRVDSVDRAEELYKYERKTRKYEGRHLVGALVFVLLTLLLDRRLTAFDWVFLSVLNLYINIYPIFLQRYNRIRILKILQSNGLKSPYDC